MKERRGKLIKGTVVEIDKGLVTASVIIRSGKKLISLVIPLSEVVKSGIEQQYDVYCFIDGKDIVLFRDVKEFFRRYFGRNPSMQSNLVML